MRLNANGKDLNRYTEESTGAESVPFVGLATPYRTDNYGTKLQAFALQHFLDGNGIGNEIIDYSFSERAKDPRKIFLPDRAAYKREKREKKTGLLEPEYMEGMKKRKRSMDAFLEESLRFSRPCRTLKEAGDMAAQKYSAVVCGSDQIWLPSHILDGYYTLSFVPKGVKRIAYAPSFGMEYIPWYIKGDCARQLKRFDTLTAREQSGKETIEKLTQRECPVAADPVLLLGREEWEKLAGNEKRPVSGRYAAGYFIGGSSGHRSASRSFAHSKGLKMVTVPSGTSSSALDERYTDRAVYGASPFDFVGIIAGADVVFTDSFHGTLFSIIFEKPFLCFERFGEKDPLSTNTRLCSLLGALGLEERLIKNGNTHIPDTGDIDYAEVRRRIGRMRESSGKILLDAVRGEERTA